MVYGDNVLKLVGVEYNHELDPVIIHLHLKKVGVVRAVERRLNLVGQKNVQEIVVQPVSVMQMVSVIMGGVNVKKTLKEMVIVLANKSVLTLNVPGSLRVKMGSVSVIGVM